MGQPGTFGWRESFVDLTGYRFQVKGGLDSELQNFGTASLKRERRISCSEETAIASQKVGFYCERLISYLVFALSEPTPAGRENLGVDTAALQYGLPRLCSRLHYRSHSLPLSVR